MSEWKETDYGKIPSKWKYVKGTEFCHKVTDGTHDSPKQVVSGRFLVTSKHIKSRDIDFDIAYKISEEDYRKIITRSHVDQWDVIISMIGEYCGFTYIERNQLPEYAVKNVGMFKTGNEDKAKWLHYYFNSKIGKAVLEAQKTGTSQPYITLGSLRNIEILLPDDEKDIKDIAEVLSSLDDKIDLLNRNNKTLEQLAETLFRQWFVEEAEDSWEEVTLGSLCDRITKGTTPTTLGKPFVENGINFIKAESLNESGGFIKNKFSFIDESTHNLLQRSKVKEGDILFTIAGTIGRTAIVTSRILPANTNQAVAIIRVDNKKVNQTFMKYVMKSDYIQEIMETKIVHAVQPNLSLGEISDTKIKLPPKGILDKFELVGQSLQDKMNKNNFQIQQLETLRDTLLPKLMSGVVRVKE